MYFTLSQDLINNKDAIQALLTRVNIGSKQFLENLKNGVYPNISLYPQATLKQPKSNDILLFQNLLFLIN